MSETRNLYEPGMEDLVRAFATHLQDQPINRRVPLGEIAGHQADVGVRVFGGVHEGRGNLQLYVDVNPRALPEVKDRRSRIAVSDEGMPDGHPLAYFPLDPEKAAGRAAYHMPGVGTALRYKEAQVHANGTVGMKLDHSFFRRFRFLGNGDHVGQSGMGSYYTYRDENSIGNGPAHLAFHHPRPVSHVVLEPETARGFRHQIHQAVIAALNLSVGEDREAYPEVDWELVDQISEKVAARAEAAVQVKANLGYKGFDKLWRSGGGHR